MVSQNREAEEVQRVVQEAMGSGITVMRVVNAVSSLIARTTLFGCYLNAGCESPAASTKAFSTQVSPLNSFMTTGVCAL